MGEFTDAAAGFQAFVEPGDQCDADEIGARVDALRFAGEEAAGQGHDIIVFEQPTGELGIGDGCLRPQVEAGVGHAGAEHFADQWRARGELLAVLVAVVEYMRLVVPGNHRGGLDRGRHGAAVVGAVEQEFLQDLRVAGNETGTHARHVGAF